MTPAALSPTDRRFARCAGTHRYGVRTIIRDFRGHRVELRVCRACGVPESPRLKTASVGARKPKVLSSYWD